MRAKILTAAVLSAGCLAGLAAPASGDVDTYLIDFFPDDPQDPGFLSLTFVGPIPDFTANAGREVVQTRLYLTFTTLPGFDASRMVIGLTAPTAGGSAIWVYGEDMGWSGEGTFTYEMAFDDLNGIVPGGRATWTFEVGSDIEEEFLGFRGYFSADSRWEIDYAAIPAPGAAGAFAAAGLVALRRRR